MTEGELPQSHVRAADEAVAAEHCRWMRQAMSLADRAAEQGEVPVGALVVLDGQVIGEGWNQPISSSDPTAHAEVMALRAAARHLNNYRMPGAVLYVTVEPCTMCAGALVHARISELVFGAAETKAGAVQSQDQLLQRDYLNWRIKVTGGVLADECGALMSDFFAARRRAAKTS